jgi:hypothetical protein
MTPQERMEQVLQRANGETMKKQEEYEEERKRVEAIDEEGYEVAQLMQRMSKGLRGRSDNVHGLRGNKG